MKHPKSKIIDNKDGTYSFWNVSDNRCVIENGTLAECQALKKQLDAIRRSDNALRRGIR